MFAIIATGIVVDLSKDYTKKKLKKWYRKYWKAPEHPIPKVKIVKRVNDNIEIIKVMNAAELERYDGRYGEIKLEDFIYV